MPELPDIEAYLVALRPRMEGRLLEGIRIISPFALRSVEPRVEDVAGRRVTGVARIGKRIVVALDGEVYCVLHLMIAGRLHWKETPRAPLLRRGGILAFDMEHGTLTLTEAGTKRRASLQLVAGADRLRALDPGGLDVLQADLAAFREVLSRENHTLKRALTDPRLFDGIGNAYSDEILHRARLSPLTWTSRLSAEEAERLYEAARAVLVAWTERLCAAARERFPEKVTAFREGMAVHGRYRQPCPVCGAPVQRIRYAERETNYCPTCQTGGCILKDRSLSLLLKGDWPRTLDELERGARGRES